MARSNIAWDRLTAPSGPWATFGRMSSEQLVAVLSALTALLVAVGGLISQVRALRKAVDGQTRELVEARERAAQKEGELKGRDYSSGSSSSS